VAAGYNRENLTAFVERSLVNLNTEALDLLQLHCPPTEVFYMPEVFGVLDDLVPEGQSMAQMALRWIQMHPAVTCSIPGGKRASQVADNVAAADLPALPDSTMAALDGIYTRFAKPLVHQRW
jgi:aryl-alcohol dehydrogenase-like predicted oxidoreductase